MRKSIIEEGKFFIGRNGGVRFVHAVRREGRPYVYYEDKYGVGGCYVESFANWARCEALKEEAELLAKTWKPL